MAQYKPKFETVQSGGLVTGGAAKPVMAASGLPTAQLRKIWELADLDRDGALDLKEFVIACFLMDRVKGGDPIPPQLDPDMIPDEKKR